jgi:hypothetical protein
MFTKVQLQSGLTATEIGDLETNLGCLRQLVLTKTLATFLYRVASIEVMAPGTQTTIQDWPGRTGYWAVGVPPDRWIICRSASPTASSATRRVHRAWRSRSPGQR